jgi:putative nucleotidyltransferase with HDIG domain
MVTITKDMLIKKAGAPKVLPAVAKKVLDLAASDDTSITQLCRVIEKDQTISAGVLKIANSAFYGLRQEVASLNQAVVILGFACIKELVIAISTKLQYKRFGITEQMLWDHSIGAAIAARRLAAGKGKDLEEIAFLGGLMHDFGKVVMNNEAPEMFLQVMQEVYNEGREPLETETRLFGFNHAELGAEVLRAWGFPLLLSSILEHHHLIARTLADFPDSLEARAIACINVADTVCKHLGIGYRTPMPASPLLECPAAIMLGFDRTHIDVLCAEILQAYEAEKASF